MPSERLKNRTLGQQNSHDLRQLIIISLTLLASLAKAQESRVDSLRQRGDNSVQEKKHMIDSIKSRVHSKVDSLRIPGDSATRVAMQKADSIRSGFQTSVDSLRGAYGSRLSKIDGQRNELQAKIDSLQKLKLPTDRLTHKMDSLTALRPKELEKVTQKMEQLKSEASKSLDQVNLPPQLQEPMSKLKQSIQGYPGLSGFQSLPGSDGKIPALDLPQFNLSGSEFNLPSASGLGDAGQLNLNSSGPLGQLNLSEKMPQLGNVVSPMGDIKDLTGKVGEYGADVKNISNQVSELKNIDKAAETQLTKLDEVQGLKKEMGGFEQVTGLQGMDEEAMKQKLKQEATKEALASLKEQATDHFAGKEEALKKAMTHVSKLKSKYAEVKSLSEIPKRVPNPMKGKPLVERLVPGVTFLIQKKDLLLLDVNPLFRFRFTGRLTAGMGWNQRFAFDSWNLKDRSLIYGPRSVVEYIWGKGFHFLFSPELMNTSIPPQLRRTPTESNKVWVAGMFSGLKKEFTVYKQIKGNTELLYNLNNTHGRSPYADRFVIRFGFEFPSRSGRQAMKKMKRAQAISQ
jgi:hypothetical protein